MAFTAQKTLNELFDEIDATKLILSDRINFFDDNETDKVYVIDSEAVTPTMERLYSSRSAHDVFVWLKSNGYLK